MNRIYLMIKHCMLSVGLMACLGSFSVYAAPGQTRSHEDGPSPMEQRKEQMEQEARGKAGEIDGTLKDFLELANKNQRPEDAEIKQASTLLDDSKRVASSFDDKEKSQFMLLQAWTDFYQKNTLQAASWSARACKTNEASRDAWNSQALFSMLVSKSPRLPRMDRPEPRQRPERER